MAENLIIYTPMYVTFFWAVVLLLSGYENNRAKFFLGIFMIAAFLLYFSHAIFFKKDIAIYQFVDPVYVFATLSVYPLYYWYIKLLTVETSYRWQNLRFLAPAFLLAIVTFLLYRLMNEEERLGYIYGSLLGNQSALPAGSMLVKIQKWINILYRLVFAVQVVYFLVQGRKLVIHYNRQIANFYSNLESKSLLWVNYILYSFVITAFVSISFNLIGRSTFLDSVMLLIIPSAIFSFLLFLIGYIGYMQNHTVIDMVRDENRHLVTGLNRFNTEQLKEKLIDLLEEKEIYKKPELKITDISHMLGTNRTYVSSMINSEFSCSFVEFINEYRIEAAKKLLAEDIAGKYSVNYIAEAAGFGSVGTFIRVFRDSVGVTPGKFRENLGNKTE